MPPLATSLPLPFGNSDAIIDTSLNLFGDKISQAVVGDIDIGLSAGHQYFSHKTNRATFGKVTLTALSFSPIHINRKSETKRTLVIPFSGDLHTIAGAQTYAAHAGHSGLFFSGEPRIGYSKNGVSELLVELDDDYLLEVAQAMFGGVKKDALAVLNLEQNRELPLTVNNIFFSSMFRNHCHTVESLRHQPESLAMLGLDDSIYRSIVALLAPALVFGDAARDTDMRAKDFNALHLLCDYIRAHLSEPITLTELESISELSARGLQYAFRRHFSCTPMQWIREQRLNLAHERLLHAAPGDTVASVALSLGFTNLGTFSNLYQQRFQQFPSVSLKYALRRKLN